MRAVPGAGVTPDQRRTACPGFWARRAHLRNPPYGNLGPWRARVRDVGAGQSLVVALLPNATDTLVLGRRRGRRRDPAGRGRIQFVDDRATIGQHRRHLTPCMPPSGAHICTAMTKPKSCRPTARMRNALSSVPFCLTSRPLPTLSACSARKTSTSRRTRPFTWAMSDLLIDGHPISVATVAARAGKKLEGGQATVAACIEGAMPGRPRSGPRRWWPTGSAANSRKRANWASGWPSDTDPDEAFARVQTALAASEGALAAL